jgi:hypothetical protein
MENVNIWLIETHLLRQNVRSPKNVAQQLHEADLSHINGSVHVICIQAPTIATVPHCSQLDEKFGTALIGRPRNLPTSVLTIT